MSCRSSPRIVFDIILLETSPMLIGRTNLNAECSMTVYGHIV